MKLIQRSRRVLLMLWLGCFWVHSALAETQLARLDFEPSNQFAQKLASGEIPTESDLNALNEALRQVPWARTSEGEKRSFWTLVGRQLGQALAMGLNQISQHPDATFKLRRYRDLRIFLGKLQQTFAAYRQLGPWHEVAVSARNHLEAENNPLILPFLRVLREVPTSDLTPQLRRSALQGLMQALLEVQQEIKDERDRQAMELLTDPTISAETPSEDRRHEDDPAIDTDEHNELGDDPIDSTGIGYPQGGGVQHLIKLVSAALAILLFILLALLKPNLFLAIPRWIQKKTQTARLDERTVSPGTSSAPQVSTVGYKEDPWRISLVERVRTIENRVAFVKTQLHSFQEEETARVRESIANHVELNTASVTTDDFHRVELDLQSLRQEVEALKSTPKPEIPPDLRPQLGQTNSSLRRTESELRKLKERQFDLIEIELGALAKLWQTAQKDIEAMPLIGPLASGEVEAKARINTICNELPNKLAGRLAESAKTVVQPIRDASLIASKLIATRNLIESQSSSGKTDYNTEFVSKTLFRIREFSFQLLKLLNTDEGRKWQEIKLSGWIRASFRNLADQIYREHWHRQLDGKSEGLSEACEAVDEILSWGDLAVIPLEPGTAFDSQKQLGTSTASRADYPDGAIVGVVRVGFRDVTTQQIIQKPEVVVNRR